MVFEAVWMTGCPVLDIEKGRSKGGEIRLNKKYIRIIIDMVMIILLSLLMAYSLIGEKFHEVIGSVIFVLFIVHHILNRKWHESLFTPKRAAKASGRQFCRKGKYNPRRIFQTVLNALLLLFMIFQPISGIMLSKHLYTFLPAFSATAQARSVHMVLAYWGYVLLCIHAGTHLLMPMHKLAARNKKIFVTVCAVVGSISVYGTSAFVKRGFPGYMTGRTAFAFFNYSEPRLIFFMDYLAIMILFMIIGCLIFFALGKINTKRGSESDEG